MTARSPQPDPNTHRDKSDPSGTMRFASALSEAEAFTTATQEVLEQLASQIKPPVDLVVMFATNGHTEHIEKIHKQINEALSPSVSLGVTVGGVIGRQREVEETPGLSVMAASMPGVTLCPLGYEQIDWQAVADAPEALRDAVYPDGDPLKAIILLADPFSTPMLSALPTMNLAWPGVPIVGGMASAATKPGTNRLLINGRVLDEGAVGVLIAGPVDIACTISQGCRPIGEPYVITKSHRHIVYELGGHNALQAIEDMGKNLEEEDRRLIQTRGLMVGRVINEYKERFGRGDFLIRHLLAADQETGYIAINDPQVRTGQTIQFHVHDQKTAQEDFKLLLEAQKLHGSACGAMLFSCNGRGTHLFDKPHIDASIVHEALGDVPVSGFFAAGEIGPVGDQNFLHGHTASLIVFREAAK